MKNVNSILDLVVCVNSILDLVVRVNSILDLVVRVIKLNVDSVWTIDD